VSWGIRGADSTHEIVFEVVALPAHDSRVNYDLHGQFAAATETVVFAELQDDFSFQTEFNLSRLPLAPTGLDPTGIRCFHKH